MKFCAVVCEYNPFHNGHRYQLAEIRRLSGCDRTLCLMSGNFTQRGEAALFPKYVRARHAVLSGADVVLELPVSFAVSPAAIFAEGAVHLLASVPDVKTLAFGCESGDRDAFLGAASATLAEDKRFRAALKERMKDGTSYVKARAETVLALNGDVDEALLTSPNNILGTEYCRALLSRHSDIEPLPIERMGAGHADNSLLRNFSSASALRAALADGSRKAKRALKGNVPACVLADAETYAKTAFQEAAMCALICAEAEDIAKTADCAEGLENGLKTFARITADYEALVSKLVSKRYTRSRIKRILAQNLLGLRLKETRELLGEPLYLRVLAVRKECAEEIFSALSKSAFPLVVRKSDYSALKKGALRSFMLDMRANDLYNVLSGKRYSDFETQFV